MRSHGEEAIRVMRDIINQENAALCRRGDHLESFAMAQFASMGARFEHLGVVVQQAMEVLDDVKSRQARVGKAYQKQRQQGYLSIVTGIMFHHRQKR